MLYDRWLQIEREHRNEIALLELSSGRRWSFAQLAPAAEAAPAGHDSRMVFPQGSSVELILAVHRAWQSGQCVCPLEVDQQEPCLQPILPGNCVHLKMTSASTGASRAIAFTAEQLAADAENIVMTMGLRPDSPNLAVVSLAHSYGFSNLITPLLLHGIPLILSESTLPESVRRAAKAAEHITLPAVPALWRTWHDADAIPKNITLAISAGAPLPIELENEIFL